MTFRRNLALLIDPSLAVVRPTEPDPEPLRLDLFGSHYHDLGYLASIARSLEKIEAKTVKRRPRTVVCAHPELHPELTESVA